MGCHNSMKGGNDGGPEPSGTGGSVTPKTILLEPPNTDDDIPEVILCDVCAPILGQNSYERLSEMGTREHGASWLPISPCQHHQSQQSLEYSANQGCYICSRLRLAGLDKAFFPLRYSLKIPLGSKDQIKGSYRLWIHESNTIFGGEVFEIRPHNTAPILQQLADRSKCRTWTGHDNITRLAKGWLGHCLKNHERCLKPSLDKWKPSRLLDVSDNTIKLVQGNSEEARQHDYATLSHCWGTRKFSVLTAATMSRYVQGVDISEFEPTFRETITTVQRLGIRYLWIDCYCIIQGSDDEALEDWRHESVLMKQVYANSLLNIGALESATPAGGLFQSRPLHAVNTRMLWSPTKESGHRVFYITSIQPLVGHREAFGKLANSALMRRGWAIQECVLAPRMLSFGSEQVFWQCSGLAACESYASQNQFDHMNTMYLDDHPFWMLGYPGASQYSDNKIKTQWISTLDAYCKSNLTYPEKDLFVALEGIMRLLVNNNGGQFKYGMWDATFPEALLFQPGSYHDKLPTRDKARPTWHWSSCYPQVGYRHLAATYSMATRISRMVYAFMSHDCKPFPDECSKDFWPNLVLIGRLVTEKPLNASFHVDTLEDEDASSSQVKFYLLVVSTKDNDYGTWYGLTLVRSESGFYRRVGSWHIFSRENDFDSRIIKTRPQLIVLE